MGYSFADLGAEGCRHSLNALFVLSWYPIYLHGMANSRFRQQIYDLSKLGKQWKYKNENVVSNQIQTHTPWICVVPFELPGHHILGSMKLGM